MYNLNLREERMRERMREKEMDGKKEKKRVKISFGLSDWKSFFFFFALVYVHANQNNVTKEMRVHHVRFFHCLWKYQIIICCSCSCFILGDFSCLWYESDFILFFSPSSFSFSEFFFLLDVGFILTFAWQLSIAQWIHSERNCFISLALYAGTLYIVYAA